MNRFYVVRVKYLADGTEKRSELMAYDTRLEAESKFHINVGTDMADTTLNGSMCVVLDSFGNSICTKYWVRTTEVAEPTIDELVP